MSGADGYLPLEDGTEAKQSKQCNGVTSETMSFFHKLSYSIGHFYNDLIAACWFTYLLVALKAQRMSPTDAGIALLVGQITDGVMTITAGYLSDRTSFSLCGMGKRKTWYFCGTILTMIGYFGTFGFCLVCFNDDANLIDFGETELLFYFCSTAALLNIGWAMVQVSHMALLPEITQDESLQVTLNLGRYAFTVLANLVAFGALFVIQRVEGNAGDDGRTTPEEFHYLALCVGAIGTLSFVLFFFFTKEPPPSAAQSAINAAKDGTQGEKGDCENLMTPGLWFQVPMFWFVSVSYAFSRFILNVSQSYLPLYVLYSLFMHESYITIEPAILYFSSFLTTLCFKHILRLFGGLRGAMLFAIVVTLGSFAGYWRVQETESWWVHLATVGLGFGSTSLMVSSIQLQADLIGQHCHTGAFVYGTMSLFDKFMTGGGIVLLQALDSSTDPDTPGSEQYYRLALTCAPVAVALVLGILLLFIDPEKASIDAMLAVRKLSQPGIVPSGYLSSINSPQVREELLYSSSGLQSSGEDMGFRDRIISSDAHKDDPVYFKSTSGHLFNQERFMDSWTGSSPNNKSDCCIPQSSPKEGVAFTSSSPTDMAPDPA